MAENMCERVSLLFAHEMRQIDWSARDKFAQGLNFFVSKSWLVRALIVDVRWNTSTSVIVSCFDSMGVFQVVAQGEVLHLIPDLVLWDSFTLMLGPS